MAKEDIKEAYITLGDEFKVNPKEEKIISINEELMFDKEAKYSGYGIKAFLIWGSFMSKNKDNNYLALCMGVGVTFGIIFNQLAIALSLGVAIGLALDNRKK